MCKVSINRSERTKERFGNMKNGALFWYCGYLYMKAYDSNNDICSVQLVTGYINKGKLSDSTYELADPADNFTISN